MYVKGNNPLPSKMWVRSTKMPEWAICLDPAHSHYGWKMLENPDGVNWVSQTRLTLTEVRRMQQMHDLLAFSVDLIQLELHLTRKRATA
jgi:hypothetical protein